MSRDHRKLRAFQLVDELVIQIYRRTSEFPDEERFGLASQMRRAVVSAAANIVEGAARHSYRDYVHFLDIARASLREVGYLVDLARRLSYIGVEAGAALLSRYEESAAVLGGLIRSARRNLSP